MKYRFLFACLILALATAGPLACKKPQDSQVLPDPTPITQPQQPPVFPDGSQPAPPQPPEQVKRYELKGRIPPTLNRNSPEAKYWESFADYQRKFKNHPANGKPITELYSSSARWVDLEKLKIKEGAVIADIGCGTGAFEMLLLSRNVPFGKIFAVDIDKESLDFLRFTLENSTFQRPDRIVPVLTVPSNPKIPLGSTDIVISINTPVAGKPGEVVNSPEEVESRKKLLGHIRKGLKPDGTLHIIQVIEYEEEKEDPADEVQLSPQNIIDFVQDQGFKLLSNGEIKLADDEEGRAPQHHIVFGVR
jgi:SAM-dependent methyltransferase